MESHRTHTIKYSRRLRRLTRTEITSVLNPTKTSFRVYTLCVDRPVSLGRRTGPSAFPKFRKYAFVYRTAHKSLHLNTGRDIRAFVIDFRSAPIAHTTTRAPTRLKFRVASSSMSHVTS